MPVYQHLTHINPYGLFPLDLSKRLGISAEIIDQMQNKVIPLDIINIQNEEKLA